MFLANPYDARTLKLLRMEDTVSSINNYIVADYAYRGSNELVRLKWFDGHDKAIRPIPLYGKSPLEKDIPNFGHPLVCFSHNWIAADFRQCTKVDKETGKVEIRNTSEFNLTLSRLILSGAWSVGKSSSLYTNPLPMLVYGDWLAQNLTRVFGLNMGDQVKLFILGTMYYTSLFSEQFEKEDMEKLKIKLVKQVFSGDLVDEVSEKVDKLDTIDDFCRLCEVVTGNIRLKNLDYMALTNLLSNNWFGLNAGELTRLSLFHPPTWLALVYAAITDRGYRNTFVAKTAENRGKRGKGEDFVKEMSNLLKVYQES